MSAHSFLSTLEALSAELPFDENAMRVVFDDLVRVMQVQFNAYMVDILWESGQGIGAHLRPVAVHDVENPDYSGHSVYRNGRAQSLTGLCFDKGTPIWITDQNGLGTKSEYHNSVDSELSLLASDAFWKYNQNATIRTEVCWPIHVGERDFSRTAGVLNLEMTARMLPNPRAIQLLRQVETIVSRMQTRIAHHESLLRLASHAVSTYLVPLARNALSKIEPSVRLTAFVAYPMTDRESCQIVGHVHDWLRSRRIHFEEPMDVAAERIDQSVFDCIRRAHFGIAITSGFNRNVVLELGFMFGANKKAIRLHSSRGDSEQDPFDLLTFKTYEIPYRGETIDKSTLKKRLASGLRAIAKEDSTINALLSKLVGEEAARKSGQQIVDVNSVDSNGNE